MTTAPTLFDVEPAIPPHPARFTPAILGVIARWVEPGWSVFDPFCGVGGIHRLRRLVPGLRTSGCEIEPRWAAAHPATICADLFDLEHPAGTFDAVVTSPAYGNRMADDFQATSMRGRRSYALWYGEALHRNNAGLLQWSDDYRDFHRRAWTHVAPWATRRLILNVKDHQRDLERAEVVAWHRAAITGLGFRLVVEEPVAGAPGYRFGANRDRYPEMVLVFDRPQVSR